MADMSGKQPYILDFDPSVLLRSDKDAAESGATTVSETPIPLNKLDTAYWQTDGEIANKRFDILVDVLDVTVAGTVTLNIQVDDNEAFSSPVDVATIDVTSAGVRSFAMLANDIVRAEPGAKYIRIQYVGTNAGDSVRYGAWVSRPALA